MTDAATLSETFELKIPEGVRAANNWKPGQEFVFIPRNGGVMLVRVPTIDEMRGIAKGADADGYRDRNDRY